MYRWPLISLTLALLLSASIVVLAQTTSFEPSPYIYKLKIGGCLYEPTERTLTGFRVKGQTGIVTALHGVAGCQIINAQPVSGNPLNNLIIAQVDIDRDVARLWSKEVDALPVGGLEAITRTQASDYQQVTLIGYPYGLFRQKPTAEVKILETTELGNLVPPDLILALNDRSSPAIDIQVLSVQAHLVPGHSGAPLLNSKGQVIGVGNGGLDLGRVEMGWAIPWHLIEWKPVAPAASQTVSWADFRRLQTLAKTEPHLFAFAAPDEVNDSVSTPTVTPTLTPTVTPIPDVTATPRKSNLEIKVIGAGQVRKIDLVPRQEFTDVQH